MNNKILPRDTTIGVNLGGWLVVERWLTPHLFTDTDAVDEYTLSLTIKGKAALERHHETFITEADFAWLAKHDITMVRIPIGYWLFDGDAPYISSITHLDNAMSWAATHHIKVLIDIHGAPGSQNGEHHSGRAGKTLWRRRGGQDQLITVLQRLARRYRDNPALWGIELVNEPSLGLLGIGLTRFYRRAYRQLAPLLRPGVYTVFADGFAPRLLSGALSGTTEHPVAMDCHFYQLFSPFDRRRTFAEQIRKTAQRSRRIKQLSRRQPIIIGEWSGALPTPVNDEQTLTYISAQNQAYQFALAHFYWTYKAEIGGPWNLRAMIEKM